jgi:hypothetical protein
VPESDLQVVGKSFGGAVRCPAEANLFEELRPVFEGLELVFKNDAVGVIECYIGRGLTLQQTNSQ